MLQNIKLTWMYYVFSRCYLSDISLGLCELVLSTSESTGAGGGVKDPVIKLNSNLNPETLTLNLNPNQNLP